MTDIATLGIRVDSTQAASATDNLDKLAVSGAAAEAQTNALTQAARTLAVEQAKVVSVTGGVASNLTKSAGAAKLTANEALNLSRQMADVGVTAAMGMSPFLILIQQGPQIYDIFKTSGMGAKDFATELLSMGGILRKTEVAVAMTATQAAALAAAEAELAAATAAVTVAQNAELLSTDRLGAARVVAAAQARQAAAANVLMAETAAAGATATVAAISPVGIALMAVAAAAVQFGAGFAILSREVSKDVGDVTKGMGLTEKQLDRIKDKGVSTTVTLGDTVKAFFQVAGERLYDAFEGPLTWLKDMASTVYNFVVEKGAWLIKETVGLFFGGYDAIKATWSLLPSAMGDVAIQAANATLKAIEDMVNGSVELINGMTAKLPFGLGEKVNISGRANFGQIDNPYAGQASKAATAGLDALNSGRERGRQAVGNFYDDVKDRAKSNRRSALEEAAGDPEKGRKAGKSDAQKEYERATKAAEDYIKSLKDETAEIGKNRIEVKMMAAERAAAAAPTEKLKAEILSTAEAWKKATIAQATDEFKRSLQDEAKELEFENSLLKMNAKEREVAIAMHQLDIRVRDMAREGIVVSAEAIAAETAAIKANAEARGQSKLDVDNAREYAEAMRDLNDTLRESVDGFGELFGTAGEGFENLINVIADYGDRRASLEERIAEATAKGKEGEEERQRASEELSRAQVAHYGNMLGAAKTFFKEGSTGYRVLEAAERAYRIYQAVSNAIAIAGKLRSMAVDTAHTASSVANSGARAAADGIAAVAKAIASLPFPLNIAAGAATIAALVAVGVKIAGKGGGGGASAASESSSKTDSGPGDSTSMTSPYSTLPGSGGLYDPRNAGVNGTSKLASANDNSYAANNVGTGGGSGVTVVYSPTINAEGASADVLPAVQDMLRQSQQETVDMARQAAAQDRAEAASRQRIG